MYQRIKLSAQQTRQRGSEACDLHFGSVRHRVSKEIARTADSFFAGELSLALENFDKDLNIVNFPQNTWGINEILVTKFHKGPKRRWLHLSAPKDF